jgi:hypothetical protein
VQIDNPTVPLTATATSTRPSGSPEPELHSGLSRSSNGSPWYLYPGTPCLQNSTDSDSTSAEWFARLREEVHEVLILDKESDSGVKVAIIDTGANLNTTQYKTIHRERISDCRTWCDAANISEGRSFMDEKGNTEDLANDQHGTHSISVLRKVAPNCTIFVAQVFRGRDDIVDRYPSNDQAQRIASVSASSQIEFCCS